MVSLQGKKIPTKQTVGKFVFRPTTKLVIGNNNRLNLPQVDTEFSLLFLFWPHQLITYIRSRESQRTPRLHPPSWGCQTILSSLPIDLPAPTAYTDPLPHPSEHSLEIDVTMDSFASLTFAALALFMFFVCLVVFFNLKRIAYLLHFYFLMIFA